MINKELGERIINILEKINRDEYADYSTREQEEAKAILKEIRKENIYEQLGYHIRKEDNQKLLKEKNYAGFIAELRYYEEDLEYVNEHFNDEWFWEILTELAEEEGKESEEDGD